MIWCACACVCVFLILIYLIHICSFYCLCSLCLLIRTQNDLFSVVNFFLAFGNVIRIPCGLSLLIILNPSQIHVAATFFPPHSLYIDFVSVCIVMFAKFFGLSYTICKVPKSNTPFKCLFGSIHFLLHALLPFYFISLFVPKKFIYDFGSWNERHT